MLTIAYLKGYMRFGSYIEPNAFSLFTVVNIQGHTKKITLPYIELWIIPAKE